MSTETIKALIPPGIRPHLRWRIAVSLSIAGIFLYILWSLGALGMPGLALASDVNDLKRTADLSARLQLANEIRIQARARCSVTDAARDGIERYIESLQAEYERITGARYPEPRCP